MLVKTNIPGYLKDTDSGAVINTNEADFIRYQAQVNQRREYLKTQAELEDLRKQMQEMKELMLSRKTTDV